MTDNLPKHGEATRFATGEAAKICAAWDQPSWDELDWSRIREIQTREIFEHRKQEAAKVQKARALECPVFAKHVGHGRPYNATVTLIHYSSLCVMTNGSSKRTYLN